MKGQLSLSGSTTNSLFVPQLCLRFGGGMENSATETGFAWECDGNSFEEKMYWKILSRKGLSTKSTNSKSLKSRKSRKR